MNTRSAEVAIELGEILKANSMLVKVVTAGPATALAAETAQTAAYINMITTIPDLQRNSAEADGYDFHGFFSVTLNADCKDNEYLIYDLADSVIRSVLNDVAIWGKLVDRNIISLEFDNAEFWTKRSAVLSIEVVYRLTCTY